MGYLNNIKKMYWFSLFHSLVLAYVIERLFWQERGMNIQMVVYCEIIYSVTVTILEIPSGIIADKVGKKKMLLIDNLMSIIEFIMILFAHQFWQFAFAVFFAGIGKSLVSGSQNALVYDSLLMEGKQEQFEKIIGRIAAIDFLGSMIAALCGSFLASWINMEINYVISIGSVMISFIIAMTMEEPQVEKKKGSQQNLNLLQYAKQALFVFKTNSLLFVYSITSAILGACMIYLDEFWQIVLNEINVPIIFFGMISAFAMILRIISNLFAYKLKNVINYKTIFMSIMILSSIGYSSIYFIQSILCLIPMMLLFLLSGIVDPLLYGYLHSHTESQIRATTESLFSIGLRIVSVVVGLLFSYISMKYSIFSAFLLISSICFIYSFVFYFTEKRANARFSNR